MSYTTSAIRNGTLCLLMLQTPLNFRNGERVVIKGEYFSKFNVKDRHHIFPANFLKKMGHETPEVHLLPNFCSTPQETVRWISDKPPSKYMQEIRDEVGEQSFDRIMRTHLIPVGDDSGIWTDNYPRFLRQRAELLLAEISNRCGIPDRISEKNRHPIVDSIEQALRDTIHNELLNYYGFEYWPKYVARHIKEDRLNQRIDDHIRKTAGLSAQQFKDPREKLNFFHIYDYGKIITENWNVFSSIFLSKSDLDRSIEDFNDFRNAVQHNRSIDILQEHRAKAAIIWFSRTMNLDLTMYDIII